MAKHGGPRPNSGRPKGGKNRSTIERELMATQALIDKARQTGIKALPKDVMFRAMEIAEGAAGIHKPMSPKEIEAARAQGLPVQEGDWDRFGQWFDRWTFCVKELMKYTSPPMKAVDAPAPPPDPRELERSSVKRFGLRVFEGGRPVQPFKSGNGAA